jgi:acetyl esterase
MRTAGQGNKPNSLVLAVSKALGKLRADEDMLEVLNAHASLDPDAIEKVSPEVARRNPTMADAVNVVLERQGRSTRPQDQVPGVTSQDITVSGETGPLPARVFTPSGTGPFPVVLYFHGGGWVLANRLVYDGGARGLARAAQALVISVDYRLAPEHKFPAAWLDAFAAYKWVLTNAHRYGGDRRLVALAGESAGGNLAVATAITAVDADIQQPVHVLAVYPVAQTDLDTESYLENAIALPLNRAMMKWFFEHTTRNEEDLQDTRLQLIDAVLEGLPPVTLITARIDPLRSDGAKLEAALRRADVAVERRDYEGVTHEFFGAAAVIEKARAAQEWAGKRLQQAFSREITS